MNVYQVVSEPIEYEEIIAGLGCGPRYDYRIGEIVAAPSRGKAKWIAWQSDDGRKYPGIEDMPNFSVKLVRKDWPGREGVVTGMDYLWTGARRPWLLPEAALVDEWLWQEIAVVQGDCDQQDFIANGIGVS